MNNRSQVFEIPAFDTLASFSDYIAFSISHFRDPDIGSILDFVNSRFPKVKLLRPFLGFFVHQKMDPWLKILATQLERINAEEEQKGKMSLCAKKKSACVKRL